MNEQMGEKAQAEWWPEPEYADCTCGHPNDHHESGTCPFPGCGCGALYDDDCQHEWGLRSEHDLWVCAWCSAETTEEGR